MTPAARESAAAGDILRCGAAGGQAAAAVIRALRSSTDTARLTRTVMSWANYRDSAVFEAALDVAGDRSASLPARLHALRTLYVLRTGMYWRAPEEFVYSRDDDLLPDTPLPNCGRGQFWSDATPHWYEGATLPADFVQRISALTARLRLDRTEPRDVRAAALCVR